MSAILHVGNISPAVAVHDLKAMFGQFGPVDTVEIAKDSWTGMSKGSAVVAMAREEDAAAAIRRLNLTQYAGRTIGVGWSQEG